MMKKESKAIILVIVLIAIPVFLFSSGWAQEKPEQKGRPRIEFEGRYWFPELSGSAKAVSVNVGSGID